MKKNITNLLLTGVFTLTMGGISVSQAQTQNEKGDAGPLKGNAESFDCQKNKWMGSHGSSTDCDLVCFWWEGGFFSMRCAPNGGEDVAIAIFGEDGRFWANEDAGLGGAVETWTGFMPKGIYYCYTGHYNWDCYDSQGNYSGGPGYLDRNSAEGTTSPTGTFYGCKVVGAPNGGSWETTYQDGNNNWEHPGIPFKQDARAGEKKRKTKGGGVLKVETKRKKAKFFAECRNNTDMRASTGVKFRGVSRRKFKQKYIEIGEGNKTAEVIKNDFCKNYNPGFKQRFKCIIKPKGRYKRMNNVKGRCILDCRHDGGETRDKKKVKYTLNK